MDAEWATFFAAWLREIAPERPPVTQRDSFEWVLERLDEIAAQGPEAA